MKKAEYHKYLKSPEWGMIRKFILTRDKYRCRLCNSGLDLQVHHRSYEHIGNEMDHPEDLISLCQRCHNQFHQKNTPPKKKKRKYNPKNRIPAPMPTIPDGDPILLTKETMEILRTPAGGFTAKTLRAIGVTSTKKKWLNKVYGREVSRDDFIIAAEGRTMKAPVVPLKSFAEEKSCH